MREAQWAALTEFDLNIPQSGRTDGSCHLDLRFAVKVSAVI